MAEPTKSYPLAFSALAFLKPKHLDPDKLFDEDDDDETLMKLRPAPETVRAAILACKEHGFSARYGGGLAISIAGDVDRFRSCFGVRLVRSRDTGTRYNHFENGNGDQLDAASPLPSHPLAAHIVRVLPSPSLDLAAPRYPKTDADWRKQPGHPEHIWPHQLRDRFSVDAGIEERRDARHRAERATSKEKGRPFYINLVDTGLAGDHEAFRKLGVTGNWGDRDFPMESAEIARLAVDNTDLKLKAEAFVSQLDEYLRWLTGIEGFLRNKSVPLADKPGVTIDDAELATADFTTVKKQCDKIIASGLALKYAEFVGDRPELFEATPARLELRLPPPPGSSRPPPPPPPAQPGPTIVTVAYELYMLLVSIRDYSPTSLSTSITHRSAGDFYHYLKYYFQNFKIYLENRKAAAAEAFVWIELHGKPNADYNGHGTGMAASMLGVARNARIISFPALGRYSAEQFEDVFGQPSTSADAVFDDACRFALERAAKVKPDSQTIFPSDYKTVSNSWSSAIAKGDYRGAEVKNWTIKIRKHLANGLLILFSAGNSHKPSGSNISAMAVLGRAGAIIVGGAWDHDRTNPGNSQQLHLSNAAHAVVFAPATRIAPARLLPDVCGFVGPEQADEVNEKPISPYVYIPTSPSPEFSYAGGGTSSACAQLAGLCGALRSRYPNLSPLEVKKAVIAGGDLVTEGSSYQGRSPEELGGRLKLANLLGAFAEVRKIPGFAN